MADIFGEVEKQFRFLLLLLLLSHLVVRTTMEKNIPFLNICCGRVWSMLRHFSLCTRQQMSNVYDAMSIPNGNPQFE